MTCKVLLVVLVISFAFESEAGGFFKRYFPGKELTELADCSYGQQLSGHNEAVTVKYRPKDGFRCAKYCLKERLHGQGGRRDSKYSEITGSSFNAAGRTCQCVFGGNPQWENPSIFQDSYWDSCIFKKQENEVCIMTERGDPCEFPFQYNGKEYTDECVKEGSYWTGHTYTCYFPDGSNSPCDMDAECSITDASTSVQAAVNVVPNEEANEATTASETTTTIKAPSTEAPTTEATTTTEGTTTKGASTEAPSTEEPSTEGPSTEGPSTEALSTEEPSTEAPSTEEPSTEGPSTEGPSTEAPSTEAPSTEAPSTEEPSTEEPSTEGPSTEGPSTEGPSTEGPSTEGPSTEVTTTEGTTTEGIKATTTEKGTTTEASSTETKPETEGTTTKGTTIEAKTTEAASTEGTASEGTTAEIPSTEGIKATTTETATDIVSKPCDGIPSHHTSLEFEGNCYVVPTMHSDIKRHEAISTCSDLGEGFHLASLKTQAIQEAVVNYVRGLKLYDDWVFVWIDGEYPTGTGGDTVTLHDGSSLMIEKWFYNYPVQIANFTGLLLSVPNTPSTTGMEGIFNYKPEMDFKTYALCDNS